MSKGKLITQHPRAQPAALRMRELGADSAAPPTAELVPQPLRARNGGRNTPPCPAPMITLLPSSSAPLSRRCSDVHRSRPHKPRPGHLQSEAALGWARRRETDRNGASPCAARLPLAPVVQANPISANKRLQTARTQSEHWALPGNLAVYPKLSRCPVQMPPPGRNDCGRPSWEVGGCDGGVKAPDSLAALLRDTPGLSPVPKQPSHSAPHAASCTAGRLACARIPTTSASVPPAS
jgi:hypothetical protein